MILLYFLFLINLLFITTTKIEQINIILKTTILSNIPIMDKRLRTKNLEKHKDISCTIDKIKVFPLSFSTLL